MNKSVFIFSCLCGRQFQKEEKESFQCPDCERLLIVEWGVEDVWLEFDGLNIGKCGGTSGYS